MICAILCNWSLYFHWQTLYAKMWTVCKILKKVFVHIFSHSEECAKSVKNLIVRLFSLLVTFTDGCWRLPIPAALLAPLLVYTTIVQTIFPVSEQANYFHKRLPRCTQLNQSAQEKTISLDSFLRSWSTKALEWAQKRSIFIDQPFY